MKKKYSRGGHKRKSRGKKKIFLNALLRVKPIVPNRPPIVVKEAEASFSPSKTGNSHDQLAKTYYVLAIIHIGGTLLGNILAWFEFLNADAIGITIVVVVMSVLLPKK